MEQKMAHHYVGLYSLDPKDQEYHLKDGKGRSPRALLEQVDGDKFFFPTVDDAKQFMTIHGMAAISDTDLEKLRAAEEP